MDYRILVRRPDLVAINKKKRMPSCTVPVEWEGKKVGKIYGIVKHEGYIDTNHCWSP